MADGFKVTELVVNGVYECRLSGRSVLIIEREHVAFGLTKYGVTYNPITGKQEWIDLYDYQLKYPSK